jgi:hypothetical protein
MNTKKLILSFLTVFFVGVMNADENEVVNDAPRDIEVVSVKNNETRNIESIKEDCKQLLSLQVKSRNTDLGKELIVQTFRQAQLQNALLLEYNQCELAGFCDKLADVFDEYKKSAANLKALVNATHETEEFKKIIEILKR